MATVRSVLTEKASNRTIFLCAVFIGLNVLDAWLSAIALAAGNYELNPILGMRFGSSMLVKGLISVGIVIALVLFKRGKLLKPLDVAMSAVCAWNAVTVLFWT